MITMVQLPVDSWPLYRDLRLEALQTDPHTFGGTYEEEIHLTPETWQKRLKSMWFAKIDQNIVGMISLVQNTEKGIKHCGFLVSFWVKPTYRRQGIGAQLMKHIQNYAASQGVRKMLLHVTATNRDALTLYESCSFENIGLMKENIFKNNRYLNQYAMEWHSPQLPTNNISN